MGARFLHPPPPPVPIPFTSFLPNFVEVLLFVIFFTLPILCCHIFTRFVKVLLFALFLDQAFSNLMFTQSVEMLLFVILFFTSFLHEL